MDFIAVLICLGLSAFFSGAEIAFFSITESRLKALADEGHKGAKLALKLRSNPQRLLSTILIGNNLVNIMAASMATLIAIRMFGSEAVAVATGLLTFMVLLFGEIVPKTLCAKYSETAVQLLAYPIYLLEQLFFPFLYFLEPFILKLTGGRGLTVPFITEEELKIMLDAGGKAGVLETDEVKMIKNVFDFNDVTAEDAMTPRIYMFALDGNQTLGEAREELFKAKYSRIPIYEGNPDNITAILYRNHALMELAQSHTNLTLKSLAKPALFIPSTKTADDLLRQFQQEKRHIAIVVNEFGGVMGLITVEDLLEEVVGEILDEGDLHEEWIRRTGKNQILVDGRTEVRRINEFLKVELDEEQNTISGLILEELGHIPAVGEKVQTDNCLLIVQEADERSIKGVQIIKEEPVPETPPTEPSTVSSES
ncbi:hemolysin family protein [Candidatus Nitrospira allomarina]|jgi:magnesium and cobalt exporter, CNNM family|uniref:Hemolysin family protein n=1 Tax=Candidatus Nitrospira allomarina TaxID=3020900 RepID=A0AA96GG88_9BACT|nr:hemolysin family protein [Candidatus Nitrospira allomarina]WNM57161.1 hemolysin family protein [Candidatus Nitrospira allomarina]